MDTDVLIVGSGQYQQRCASHRQSVLRSEEREAGEA